MVLGKPAPVETEPLELRDVADPEPGPGEIVVAVAACGVCRTDLHVVEGELEPQRPALIPGHQVVGRVAARAAGSRRFAEGDRVGVAWLQATCGACAPCDAGQENLCRAPTFTGWHADGGFAERVRVREDFAYAIPEVFGDAEATPLLCAGIIGYRALRRAAVPHGGRLGLWGFGSSAHLALQVARHWGCEVYAVTRQASHRSHALELGAVWAGGLDEAPPVALDSAILFAPVGDLVPPALRALRPGGTLACAGIHMTDVPRLDYARELFDERTLTSVTANTRADGREFLALAAEVPIRARVETFALERANEALLRQKRGAIIGSAVLLV